MEENNIEIHSKKKSRFVYELLDLLKTFLICFVIVFLFTQFLLKPVHVDGDSMYPTLKDEEVGFVNIFSAKHLGIHRFDVVVVHHEETDDNWVKRVIGLPHDTIYAKDDVLYINGEPQEESYLNTSYVKSIRAQGRKFTEDFGPITLKDDEYFVMGDNRVVSHDSRAVGPFHKEDIIGKNAYILYPFNEMKIVNNPMN